MDKLEKPIISRQGLKGGRFIDGLYACPYGLEKIMGPSIIMDMGIFSDHMLVINDIDLGIKKFALSKDRDEQIDFRKIMNVPMHIKKGDVHPSLNKNSYKGEDYIIPYRTLTMAHLNTLWKEYQVSK
jgi:hypothetical protein